jgi:hypothetical protein
MRRRAHAPVSRRPLNPCDAIATRTEGYTYAENVWELSIFCRPVPKPYRPIRKQRITVHGRAHNSLRFAFQCSCTGMLMVGFTVTSLPHPHQRTVSVSSGVRVLFTNSVESSRASPPHRPREGRLALSAGPSRSDLAGSAFEVATFLTLVPTERGHPTGRERVGSPTLQTLQEPISLCNARWAPGNVQYA